MICIRKKFEQKHAKATKARNCFSAEGGKHSILCVLRVLLFKNLHFGSGCAGLGV